MVDTPPRHSTLLRAQVGVVWLNLGLGLCHEEEKITCFSVESVTITSPDAPGLQVNIAS